MEFDDLQKDIISDIEASSEQETSIPDYSIEMFNRAITVDFWNTTAVRSNGIPYGEGVCRRYMQMSRCLTDDVLKVSLSLNKNEHKRSFALPSPRIRLSVMWKGTFGRSSREILMMLDTFFWSIRETCGLDSTSILAYTKEIGEDKFKTLCAINNISTGYPIYAAIKKVMFDHKYFDSNMGMHDAVDGLYELVTRMLQADNVLCQETMDYMMKRTMGVLKKHPVFNAVKTSLFTHLSSSPVLINDETLIHRSCDGFLLDNLEKDEYRTLFIAKTIRKKKDMQRISIFPEDIFLKDDDPDKKMLNIFKDKVNRNSVKILSVKAFRDKEYEMGIYSLSPIFHDNEMYYCLLFEKTRRKSILDMPLSELYSKLDLEKFKWAL